MSNAPEEFDELQKLLKLKRYEQPPPGYFSNFSTHVINRLEKQAQGGKWGDATWLMRLLGMLETNPVAAGLFGMSVCGLLISGIAYSQSPAAYSNNSNVTIDVADSGAAPFQAAQMAKTASVDSFAPSTSALFATNAASLFNVSPSVQQVNFQLNQ